MGLTTIIMILVIVWAVKEIGKDLGIGDRIRNGGRNRIDDDDD